MSYEDIKRTLSTVDREVRAGDMSVARAHEVITNTPWVTPHDVSERLSREVFDALRKYARRLR